MSVPYLSDIEVCAPMRFSKGNKIGFWMDFCYWEGIPADRNFYIAGEGPSHHQAFYLVARGYGVHGDYGNGSIMVKKTEIESRFREAIEDFWHHHSPQENADV